MKKVEVFIFDIYTPKKAKNLGSNQVKKLKLGTWKTLNHEITHLFLNIEHDYTKPICFLEW